MPQNTHGNFSSEYVISEEVLATIAANAAKDVEGVARLGRCAGLLQLCRS